MTLENKTGPETAVVETSQTGWATAPLPGATPAGMGLRLAALVALFTVAPIVESSRLSALTSLSGADLWWHLRTGIWILDNHALPHNGIYSQSSNAPWIAVSWAYDLLLAIGYRLIGLSVIPGLLMALRAALAAVTFILAGGLRGRFWLAVVLSAIAQYVLGSFLPTPLYCSILLFGVELLLLFEARTTGNTRVLLWMAPLFLVWANVSPEFVYGLAALFLFLLAKAIEQKGNVSRTVWLVSAIALISTLFTPSLYGAWESFIHNLASAANEHFPDHLAMRFHLPRDYVLLLVTMTAFLALGLRRSRDLFPLLLLTGCASLSFYSQRDIWLVTLASIAVVAECLNRTVENQRALALGPRVVAGGIVAILLLVAFLASVPHSKEQLLAKISDTYPVAAADYIREHNLPQPLFNSYEWGGFLMWYQPQIPVAIDGRTDLYPDDAYITYSKVMNADLPYTSYPAFVQARTILLPTHCIIAQALSAVPAFRVVYHDDVATILAPTNQEP